MTFQDRLVARRIGPLFAIGGWLLVAGAGMAALWSYSLAPGPVTVAPATWPGGSHLPRASGSATLLVFAHPRCPCTRATVGELARLMARAGERVAARVVFVRPAGEPDAWVRTDLWDAAAAIPRVEVAVDPDGAEARRFGAETSGQALLYDEGGWLLFQGGITGARGHAGDNAGEASILTLARAEDTEIRRTPVFGCALFDPDGRCASGEAACLR